MQKNIAHPNVRISPLTNPDLNGFNSIDNPTKANNTENHIPLDISCLPVITKNNGTKTTLILVINAEWVGVEDPDDMLPNKPKFWKE